MTFKHHLYRKHRQRAHGKPLRDQRRLCSSALHHVTTRDARVKYLLYNLKTSPKHPIFTRISTTEFKASSAIAKIEDKIKIEVKTNS